MSLQSLQEDLKQAQLQKEELKVSTLRMLISELNNARIQKGQDLSETELVSVIQKELKKRQEAILSFRQAGREEMAAKEEAEAVILKHYLPEQLSDEQLQTLVDEAITKTGATGLADMGKVIAAVMGQAQGQVEGARVSLQVKEKLGHG